MKGFELMIGAESARHFFRFVMTRDIDWSNMEGLIEDFACGVDPYVLNREPVDFQYLRLLGTKQLKHFLFTPGFCFWPYIPPPSTIFTTNR